MRLTPLMAVLEKESKRVIGKSYSANEVCSVNRLCMLADKGLWGAN
jgi:hypothetical protein